MANRFQINRLIVNGEEIFNISDSTAEAAEVEKGQLFYAKTGAKTEGTDPKISAFETLKVTKNNTIYDAPIINDIHTVYSSVVVDIPTEPLEVTENKTYYAPSGTVGYSPVTVNLPTKSLNVTTPSVVHEAKKDGVYGYDKVTVNVPIKDKIEITDNGTYKASDYTVNGQKAAGIKEIEVAVPLSEYFRADTNKKVYYAKDYGYKGFEAVYVEVEGTGGSGGGISEDDLKGYLGQIDELVSGSAQGILPDALKVKLREIILLINQTTADNDGNIKAAVNSLIAKYNTVVSQNTSLTNTVNSQKSTINNLNSQLTTKTNQLNTANSNLNKANAQIADLQEEIERLEDLKEVEIWNKSYTGTPNASLPTVATITYAGETLTTLNAGQTTLLNTDGFLMLGDVKVETKSGLLIPSNTITINTYGSRIEVGPYAYANTNDLRPKAVTKAITENRDYSASEFGYGTSGISSFSVDVVADIDDLDDLANLIEIDALIGEDF